MRNGGKERCARDEGGRNAGKFARKKMDSLLFAEVGNCCRWKV